MMFSLIKEILYIFLHHEVGIEALTKRWRVCKYRNIVWNGAFLSSNMHFSCNCYIYTCELLIIYCYFWKYDFLVDFFNKHFWFPHNVSLWFWPWAVYGLYPIKHLLCSVFPVYYCLLVIFYCSAKVLVRGEPNVSYICSRYYRAPELIFGATDYTCQIGKISCVDPFTFGLLLRTVNTRIML